MLNETIVLAGTAATIGLVHTLLGPDHYIPFIALSKSRKWNSIKTAMITFLCGIGHVLSSIVLGFIGIALGVAIFSIEEIESLRGEIAAWFLLAFGFAYLIWGLHKAIRGHPHDHSLSDGDNKSKHSLTVWAIFIIFVLGPCEPLIPLVMYPAFSNGSMIDVAIVSATFGSVTIATMLSIVMASFYGITKLSKWSNLSHSNVGRYSHALAGMVILLCGVAVTFLGL